MRYLCDVIGKGTIEEPFRPTVADIPGISWSWTINNDPVIGAPLDSQVITTIITEDYKILEGIPGIIPL